MKIIITGASGFIGKNLLLKLKKEWDVTAICRRAEGLNKFVEENNLRNVKVFRCDLSKKDDVEEAFKKLDAKFDVCIYLAGNTDPSLSVDDPGKDLADNALAIVNFLKHLKAKKIVFFSSGAVYHGLEENVDPSLMLEPKLPYAISKYA